MRGITTYGIRVLTAICLCLLLLPSLSRAEARQVRVDLGGGLSLPAGPEVFRKDHNTGFHIFTAVRYPLVGYTELTGRLEYHLITIDFGEHFNTNLDLGGGGIDMLFLGTDIKQYFRKTDVSVRPFVLAGGGWSRLSQSSITSDLAFEQYAPLLMENQSRFYFNLGLGADLRPAQSWNLFLLFRYVEIEQDLENLNLFMTTLGFRL